MSMPESESFGGAAVPFGQSNTCRFCGGRITEADDADKYVEVSSWVTGPKLQSPVLRKQTGNVAHKDCVQNILNGNLPDQERLDI